MIHVGVRTCWCTHVFVLNAIDVHQRRSHRAIWERGVVRSNIEYRLIDDSINAGWYRVNPVGDGQKVLNGRYTFEASEYLVINCIAEIAAEDGSNGRPVGVVVASAIHPPCVAVIVVDQTSAL